MSPHIEEIIELIKPLSLKVALGYLVTKGILDFSKKGYEKIKKIIQDKHNEGKYAFVPNKEEANLLLEFERHPDFRQVCMLVPNYRYIDIIRTGLLIDHYHRNDTPKNRERVKKIKFQITRRPNGKKLLKLVNLPTTPFFSLVLQHLYELKKEGYSAVFLEEKFDEIIQDWEKASKLVEKKEHVDDVISFCKQRIAEKNETFFILGMKSASTIVEKAMKAIREQQIFEKSGYTSVLTKSNVGNQPRIEVMVYLKYI